MGGPSLQLISSSISVVLCDAHVRWTCFVHVLRVEPTHVRSDVVRLDSLSTHVDAESVEYATANVVSNSLTALVDVRHVTDPTCVLVGVVEDGVPYDFCMCNPPFFASHEEMGKTHDKAAPPRGVCDVRRGAGVVASGWGNNTALCCRSTRDTGRRWWWRVGRLPSSKRLLLTA